MNKSTLEQRENRAKAKAEPLILKYRSMSIEQTLTYIKENRTLWKSEHNIINRYYNLMARGLGFAGGVAQAKREGAI